MLLAVACSKTVAPASPSQEVAVELARGGEPVMLDAAATSALAAKIEKAITACNFSSKSRPEIFTEDVAALWKKREASSHLRLRYASDQTVQTLFGKLTYTELLLSIGEPYGPEPALAKTPDGVLGLKKCGYDDRFLGCTPELAKFFPRPEQCPPGF